MGHDLADHYDGMAAVRFLHDHLPGGAAGVPKMLYEAAVIDGANRFQQFRSITWPLLGAATLLLTIMNVIYSFHVFDLIFVMTGGGPGYSTTVLVQYIYNLAFTNGDMGYACAVAMALFVHYSRFHDRAVADVATLGNQRLMIEMKKRANFLIMPSRFCWSAARSS